MLDYASCIEGCGAECARHREGNHRLVSIDPHFAASEAQLTDPAHAAESSPVLPGRSHLKRSKRGEKTEGVSLLRYVHDAVNEVQDRFAVYSGRKGRDLQGEKIALPFRGREGEIPVGQ